MEEDFTFKRPEEAPTFYPSEEEFADPLGYINKIRPTAEKFGICKIKPPGNWAPPFAVDVDKFKFTPRIQKINELEAITRIRLNFIDQISKFWELQGTSLRIPTFNHKVLDLYTLHQLVHLKEFKNQKYTEDKKWNVIAKRMGLSQTNSKISVGTQLKAHYDKILHPFDVWDAKRGKKKPDTPKKSNNKGGRMGGRMGGHKAKTFDPLANYVCQICKGGDDEEKMLLCDGCDDSYHTFCLEPPLDEVPKGEWQCPDCLEEKLKCPNDGFGFEQAQKEYTLQQFGEMADDFKVQYFNMPVHIVSTEMVEKEFWRIVSTIDEDVTVEYGADLHTMDHGSGFPTVSNSISDSDEKYINSGWNLNKLPVLKGSVFAHINADISGMKIPWMYVGMCFSTFCWHNEDHWSYSINYLHWGEPKTWYGVPGGRADDFETAMKSAAPELFAQAPDLLHQLVTIMNPNILMDAGVPVYRMDQKAGEFIITFPRAYHAGFNQGYNFAEAVNFAPADWVQMGRECVSHYSRLNRFCVFSHDELVCAMAAQPEKLDISIALATYKDIVKMFEAEKEHRAVVRKWGCKDTEKVLFEDLADDGRQCNVCKTTLFLSAVACNHSKGSSAKDTNLVCLKHYDQYGCKECQKDPTKHVVKYRYSIDDLEKMITGLRKRVESYDKWINTLTEGLKSEEQKLSLEQLRDLVEEARKTDYPQSELLKKSMQVLDESERVYKVAKELIGTPAVRTRKGGASEMRFKCSIDELQILALEMSNLKVLLPETQHCTNLYLKAKEIQEKASKLLLSPNASIDEMSDCIKDATSLDVGYAELYKLKNKYEREKWLRLANSDNDDGSVWTMDFLRKVIEDGNDVQRNEAAEKKMEELCLLYEKAFTWEERASKVLGTKTGLKYEMKQVQQFIENAQEIPVALPSLPNLREIITKSTNWLEKVKNFQPPNVPFLDDLISVVEIGEVLPIRFEHLAALRSQIMAANIWRENCMKVFLKRNSTIELIEALAPRREIPSVPQRGKKRRLVMEGPSLTFIANVLGIPPPDVKNENSLIDAYWRNAVAELNAMKVLRKANLAKLNPESGEDSKFCVCQKPKDGFMIRCELCLEWFHPTCVPLPRIPSENPIVAIDESDSDGADSQALIAYRIACRETKYLGPCCSRSRRPEYRNILGLLVGLNKLPLHMIEGVALQCLTDRAMKWQGECDRLFQIPEVKEAAELVRSHSSSVVTSPVKKLPESENEVSAPSQIKFFDPILISFSNSVKPNGHSKSPAASADVNDASPSASSESEGIAVRRDKEVDIAMILAGMDKEVIHPPLANSSEQAQDADKVQLPLQNGHKDGNLENGMDEPSSVPKIQLSPQILEDIENLLIEADLMEVSAEEGDVLWKLYDLANPSVVETRDLMEIQKLIQEELSSKGLGSLSRKLDRKRKAGQTLSEDERSKKSPRKSKLNGDISMNLEEETQENDEDCAFHACRRPTGREVLWVQCDHCDKWFHCVCVGIKKKQLKVLGTYLCSICIETDGNQQSRCDVDDGSSCDTDSKLSSSGQLSISSNKENAHGANDADRNGVVQLVAIKEEVPDSPEKEYASNSLSVFSKVN